MTDLPLLTESQLSELDRDARALPTGRHRTSAFDAPPGLAEALMGRLGQRDGAPSADWVSTFWGPPDGQCWVGLGAAKRFSTGGIGRFLNLQKQLEEWFLTFGNLEENCVVPRVFGGASFGLPRDAKGPWAPFGDATFVAPRVLYQAGADGARLVVTLDSDGLNAVVGPGLSLGSLLRWCMAALRDVEPLDGESEPHPGERPVSRFDPAWMRFVQDAKHEILAGALQKVVLARRVSCQLGRTPCLREILTRLGEDGAGATRFALDLGNGLSFVGASPERLARVTGQNLQTEALAGTMPKAEPSAEARLFESKKERLEHRLVVDAILSAIEPLSVSYSASETPDVVEQPNLFHLRTPIEATLRLGTRVLDVIDRLHPTPAVAGSPRDAALAHIERVEPTPRGWYAGPFGWVDSEGNGEFVVALRSALLEGSSAHLFAGAGIVQDSDPAREFRETEIKLARMRTALGIRTPEVQGQAEQRTLSLDLSPQP